MIELKNIYIPVMEDLTQVEAQISEQLRFLTAGHKFVNEIVSAIILIKKIKNTPVLLQSVIISGTIKKVSSYTK